jgi:hypothetical protein
MIFNLDLGGKILQGKVILAGQIVIGAGGAAGVVVGEGGPANLIKRIIVNATPAAGSRYPGGKIVDDTPRALLRYAINQHNGKFIGEQSGSTLGDGVSGVYDVYLSIPIYWADATKRNQVATALNADLGNYASIQLEVDTGDLTSCFEGNTGIQNLTGLTVQWVDDRVALAGDTLVMYQEDHVMLIGAPQRRALDNALPQDGTFDQWLIMQEEGAYQELADTILNRLTVTGPTVLYDKYLDDIRQQMYDDEWLDPAQNGAGLSFIDWTDGVLANAIPASQLSVQFDVANPSGSNQDDLLIYTRRVYSPLPANS